MYENVRDQLRISPARLEAINQLLLDPNIRIINDFLGVVAKYGAPDEINQQAQAARQLPALLKKVEAANPAYLADLEWLDEQRRRGAFIPIPEYRQRVLGPQASQVVFKDNLAVTLEVSALQYFPWLISAARRAIAQGSLMPSRFIQVRKMKEQEIVYEVSKYT